MKTNFWDRCGDVKMLYASQGKKFKPPLQDPLRTKRIKSNPAINNKYKNYTIIHNYIMCRFAKSFQTVSKYSVRYG